MVVRMRRARRSRLRADRPMARSESPRRTLAGIEPATAPLRDQPSGAVRRRRRSRRLDQASRGRRRRRLGRGALRARLPRVRPLMSPGGENGDNVALMDARPEGLSLHSTAGRVALTATIAASAMASLDATIVNVALPHIGQDLDASVSSLQWVLTGYLLALASLILLAGALGDRWGRRRVFLLGTIWFAAASLLCGVAPSIELLIVARVLQGIGGALLTPGSLAIIQSSFREADRAAAVGAWSGLGGVAGAIGPFVRHVRHAAAPLVPPSLFADRTFTVVNIGTVLLYGSIGLTFFLVAYELQVAARWTALEAGVAMLPATVLMLVLSARSGALA